MSNMNRRSLDPNKEHVSPLGKGMINRGYDNIHVKLLKWPDETLFKRLLYQAATATRGNDVAEEHYDPVVAEDMFKGGLNQALQWDTISFEISGVTRGFTHELVRSRRASFAQQSMRHTDMSGAEGLPNVRMPEEIANASRRVQRIWTQAMDAALDAYETLCEEDVPFQDARTVLPIATETYIVATYDVQEFLNVYSYRACYMFYPEMVYVMQEMGRQLGEACPWLKPYIKISCERTGPGHNGLPHRCTYQGWEPVEGHCPLPWAKEDNRTYKSRRFGS